MPSLDRPEHYRNDELLDMIERLLAYSRAATFDEADGEADLARDARALLARYKPAD